MRLRLGYLIDEDVMDAYAKEGLDYIKSDPFGPNLVSVLSNSSTTLNTYLDFYVPPPRRLITPTSCNIIMTRMDYLFGSSLRRLMLLVAPGL